MDEFAIALFAAAVIGIPIALLLFNDYGKKRGCGRGCATCGNRDICHPASRKTDTASRNKSEQNITGDS